MEESNRIRGEGRGGLWGGEGRHKVVTPSNLHFQFSIRVYLFPYAGIIQIRLWGLPLSQLSVSGL
jgi:hypothetical protein